MTEGKVKRVFPGGNTSRGFYSYYDYILRQEDANRIFIIKGGPGVGKSTFMKKIAAEVIKKGYDIELMHCSSDPGSLDAIVIPKASVALVDGTAPHIVDPKTPGAVDEIINLADYWNEEGIKSNRLKILNTNKEIRNLFTRAYSYIRAAFEIYKDSELIYFHAMDHQKVNMIAENIIANLFRNHSEGESDRNLAEYKAHAIRFNEGIADEQGKWRKLFASAITPQGLVNYLHTVLVTEKVYKIKGLQGTGIERLLDKIATAAVENGYDVECYYCALEPEKLEHVVIPGKNVSFTTVNTYHNSDVEAYEEIDLNEYIDLSLLDTNEHDIEFNEAQFDHLMGRAIETLKKAKSGHDDLEQYYIPYMDFDSVQKKTIEVTKKVLEYAESAEHAVLL